ncbi:MAG: HIT family protein [Eubacteriales bacterium]|nr:HIT family protein [Eubacteriales bacterium]
MCLFCDLAKNNVKENELCYLLYDKYPLAPGHSLIIPKRHMTTVFEMTAEEWAAAGELINVAKAEIEKKYQPVGYNIKVNCGKAAGQEIMHAHIHLIPKY